MSRGPLGAALELQRQAIEAGQQTLATGIDFQTNVSETVLLGIEKQERVQRRLLSIQHVLVHRLCERVEEDSDSLGGATDGVRDVTDRHFSQLYENHGEFYDTLLDELEVTVDVYDEVAHEYVDAVDETVALAVTAHEELETQSIEALEQWDDQLSLLDGQVDTFGSLSAD